MSPKEIHDDVIKHFGMSLLLTAWRRNGLLNLEEGGRAWRVMKGMADLKRVLQTKTLSLYTV